MDVKSAMPGERWLVNLQPINAVAQNANEVVVTLQEFDPRTDTWTVRRDDTDQPVALLATHLIRRLS